MSDDAADDGGSPVPPDDANENGENGDGSAGSADGAGANGDGAGADSSAGPAELLSEVRAIRRRARLARHAYWFPLVLFGLLACGSVPFYIQHFPARSGTVADGSTPGPAFLQRGYFSGFGLVGAPRGLPYYWLGAILLGITASVLWYRWRGNRVGLRTPARGYLITGLVVVALALVIPLIAEQVAGVGRVLVLPLVIPGDLVARGTFPLVLIGLGLCYLAWAERSIGLAIIAAGYLALSLVASLYDVENLSYYAFGAGISPAATALPNVLLPALVLLLSGAGAWVVQRRQHAPAPED
ncbi:MAG TPA: hypothetical protein VH520_12045 [Streptosporangiaceae bacterium]